MAEITATAEIVAPNKYNNSRIYKICSNLTDKIYIGSTTKTLSQRLTQHKYSYKKNIETNNYYVSSFEIIKLGDFSIVLIEECNFNTKQQLFRREGEIIKLNINIVVNIFIAGRTGVEYIVDNKEHVEEYRKKFYNDNKTEIAEQRKQFYNDNKTQIAEKQKLYYIDNRQQIGEYYKQYNNDNKEQRKKFYIDNKTQITEYNKQYQLNNKEKIVEYQKQYYLKQKALKALTI